MFAQALHTAVFDDQISHQIDDAHGKIDSCNGIAHKASQTGEGHVPRRAMAARERGWDRRTKGVVATNVIKRDVSYADAGQGREDGKHGAALKIIEGQVGEDADLNQDGWSERHRAARMQERAERAEQLVNTLRAHLERARLQVSVPWRVYTKLQ